MNFLKTRAFNCLLELAIPVKHCPVATSPKRYGNQSALVMQDRQEGDAPVLGWPQVAAAL